MTHSSKWQVLKMRVRGSKPPQNANKKSVFWAVLIYPFCILTQGAPARTGVNAQALKQVAQEADDRRGGGELGGRQSNRDLPERPVDVLVGVPRD